MCNYGAGRNCTKAELVNIVHTVLDGRETLPDRILLGTYGSILDSSEMAPDKLERVLYEISKYKIPYVMLETYYRTINPTILGRIRAMLPDTDITIEMGLESSDPYNRKQFLNKNISNPLFAKTINVIHQNKINAAVNVILGIPNLNIWGQIRDAKNTLLYADEIGADEMVLFPMNIHPNTVLYGMYEFGGYQVISHWELIELISILPDNILKKLSLSWFGDRQEAGELEDVVPPFACPKCKPLLMEFYKDFNTNFDVQYRRQRILQLIHATESTGCDCYRQIKEQLRMYPEL